MHLCRSTSAFSMCPDGFKVGTLKPYSLKFETSNLHNWTWDLARPPPPGPRLGKGGQELLRPQFNFILFCFLQQFLAPHFPTRVSNPPTLLN